MAHETTEGDRPVGLRERKRRATRAAIERAAITLVDECGYDGVTVAQICDRANVSQGTFFNYFPTKDAAIVGIGVYELDPKTVHAAFDRLMPSSMFHATLSLFIDVVGSFDWKSDIAALRMALVKDTPALMRLFLDNTFGFVSDFRLIVTTYMTEHPACRACAAEMSAEEEASIVVSEALEAAKFALYHVADDPAGGLPKATEVEAIIRRIVG